MQNRNGTTWVGPTPTRSTRRSTRRAIHRSTRWTKQSGRRVHPPPHSSWNRTNFFLMRPGGNAGSLRKPYGRSMATVDPLTSSLHDRAREKGSGAAEGRLSAATPFARGNRRRRPTRVVEAVWEPDRRGVVTKRPRPPSHRRRPTACTRSGNIGALRDGWLPQPVSDHTTTTTTTVRRRRTTRSSLQYVGDSGRTTGPAGSLADSTGTRPRRPRRVRGRPRAHGAGDGQN